MLDSSYWIGFCGPHTQPVKRSRTVNTTIIATGWVAVAVATSLSLRLRRSLKRQLHNAANRFAV